MVARQYARAAAACLVLIHALTCALHTAHTTRLIPCRSQPAMMASGLYSVCCQLGRAVYASMYAFKCVSCAGISQPRKYEVVTCGNGKGHQ